jgi:hypothetical protein
MRKETRGPAFPFDELHDDGAFYAQYFGMTLRDYFAAKAMQGLLANSQDIPFKLCAHEAYEYADAMLKAREA